MTATTAGARAPEKFSREGRRSAVGAFLGYFVDFYDIYLPTITLAPAMTYFQPESLSTVASTTIYYVTFVVTLLGRPVGAALFGHLADSIGRKPSTLIAVGGFGAVTLLIALLPGFASWGWFAIIALILLRLVDGIFLGGEYTAAVPLAMERAPRSRRAVASVRIMLGYPAAFIAISALTSLMLAVAPVASGAYLEWGWRVPFLVGAALSLVVLVYYRRVEEDAPPAESRQRRSSPLRELFARGPNRRSLVQVFVLMTGMWLSLQTAVSMMPGLLTSVLGLPSGAVTLGTMLMFAVLAVVYLGIGRLAERVGRKPVLIAFGVATATVVAAIYWVMVATAQAGSGAVRTLVLAGLVVVIANAPWGILSAYIPERFPPDVRASGFGVGYTFAVLLPSCYSFFLVWLSSIMPYEYTQIPLVVVGGVLAAVGAAMGPETKNAVLTPGGENR